jgi:pyruvate kinase
LCARRTRVIGGARRSGVRRAGAGAAAQKADHFSCAYRLSKPVITASQMLQSMIEAPPPTRAEAVRRRHAILTAADAIIAFRRNSVGHTHQGGGDDAKIAEAVEASPTFSLSSRARLAENRSAGTRRSFHRAISRATVVMAEAAQRARHRTSTESGAPARDVGATPASRTACWGHPLRLARAAMHSSGGASGDRGCL